MMGKELTTLLSALFLASSLAACGGGGGSGDNVGDPGGDGGGTAPTISALSFGPSTVYVGTDGGEMLVVGTLDYADPDGDIVSLTIVVRDESGQVTDDFTTPIEGVAGSTTGTIEGELVADTSIAGTYTAQVYVTDSRGHSSNQLEYTVRIVEFPWVARQPMLLPRRDFATATLAGRIYIIGGGDVTTGGVPAPPTTTVEVYDPETDSWTFATPMLRAVTNHVAVTLNGKIYVIGGEEEFLPMSDAVQEYDPTTELWTLRGAMPTARESAAAAAFNGRIFVIGGTSGGMDIGTVEAYDPATDSWESLAPLSEPRRDLAAEVVGGELLALGGYTGTYVLDAGYRRAVEVYDPVGGVWWAAGDMPIPRADFASAVVATDLIVAGGNNWARGLNDVTSLNAESGIWQMKTAMPEEMAWPRGEVIGGKLYVFDTGATYQYTSDNDIL
jgi:N-acetylneuraminic acid mutarotase